MFEHRRTVRSLYKLARERAKARSIRIPITLAPKLRALRIAITRMLIFTGAGVGCAYLPFEKALALAGGLGLVTLGFRWERVALATGLPPPYFSLYPASAERIWSSRFRLFRLSSLWYAVAALAVISCLAINRQISVPSALASIPSALAFAAWMAVLPLLLALVFPSFRPGRITSQLMFLGVVAVFCAKEAPIFLNVIMQWLAPFAWFIPTGWFYLFVSASLHPALRFLLGIAALAAGALLTRPLASALQRRVIQREEDADASDASVSIIGKPLAEARDEPKWIPQPTVTPLGEAHSLVDGDHWGTFPGPQSLSEKLFWRTLNARQKSIAKLIWPLGLRWNKSFRLLYRLPAGALAIAAILRLIALPKAGWLSVAYGAIFLFCFAPLLPGYEFIFQPLLLGGRSAARCLLFPVSITEISRLLHRCQTIRAAAACWIAAAYGGLASIAMGQNICAGISAGLSIIFISFAFHPFALIAKLTSLTQTDGRQWASIPNMLIRVIVVVFALVGILVAIVGIAVAATSTIESRNTIYLATIPICFAFALAFRLIGQLLLKIYLFMIERSWIDAVIKLAKERGLRPIG